MKSHLVFVNIVNNFVYWFEHLEGLILQHLNWESLML